MQFAGATKDLDEYRLRVDRPLLRWDRHVSGCPECLWAGTQMCLDGEDLASQVRQARLALVRAEARVHVREAKLLRLPLRADPLGWLRVGRAGAHP
ncbi:MAG TPA: hypothetical protein VK424_00620 [Thermoplasmata archaeon]|nr:hypothetical protein [Thermoplasmata archaeon]